MYNVLTAPRNAPTVSKMELQLAVRLNPVSAPTIIHVPRKLMQHLRKMKKKAPSGKIQQTHNGPACWVT